MDPTWLLYALLTLPNGTLEIRLDYATQAACQAKAAAIREVYRVGRREWLTKPHLTGSVLAVTCTESDEWS